MNKYNLIDACNKIKDGDTLTREQEAVYMIEVLKVPPREVERILAINENDNPNLIID